MLVDLQRGRSKRWGAPKGERPGRWQTSGRRCGRAHCPMPPIDAALASAMPALCASAMRPLPCMRSTGAQRTAAARPRLARSTPGQTRLQHQRFLTLRDGAGSNGPGSHGRGSTGRLVRGTCARQSGSLEALRVCKAQPKNFRSYQSSTSVFPTQEQQQKYRARPAARRQDRAAPSCMCALRRPPQPAAAHQPRS